jgi:hypothetical protein
MDLQEFVAQTLIQISEGVAAARAKKGARIAPQLDVAPKESDRVFPTRDGDGPAYLVTFDVAITAAEKSAAGGGGGIQVMSFITAKGEKSQTTESSSVSRVRFDVPISYAHDD